MTLEFPLWIIALYWLFSFGIGATLGFAVVRASLAKWSRFKGGGQRRALKISLSLVGSVVGAVVNFVVVNWIIW